MEFAVQIVSIIISIALIILVLMQVKGGGLGDLLGGNEGGVARTRRGLEKTLHQLTIGLSIAFIAISILSVVYSR